MTPPPVAIDSSQLASSFVMFLGTAAAVYIGFRPLLAKIQRQEEQFATVLQGNLLLDIPPRVATIVAGAVIVFFAFLGYLVSESLVGAFLAGVLAGLLPAKVLTYLRARRLAKLETQLVTGIQTLSSGVRAGLNLVQSMGLIARDGPMPLRQEFSHLLREYEYGMPLEEAMDKAGTRIGSGDFRLVFAALQTHRERGGDLGETLDRIAESIREIQRLESRVKTLTAQGRANARFLGLLVMLVMGIVYAIDPGGVQSLFEDTWGKALLVVIVLLNAVGFMLIRWIIRIDI